MRDFFPEEFADRALIGFVPIARPTFDVELAQDRANWAHQHLLHTGVSMFAFDQMIMSLEAAAEAGQECAEAGLDALVIFQATFADSTMVMRIVEQVPDVPVLLWAVPEERTGGRLRLNSLCGINLAGHALTRAGYRYQYVYAPIDDERALQKAVALGQAGRVRRKLRQARIGRVGEHPAGFESCQYDAAALQNRFGLEVVPLPLQEVFTRVPQAPAAQVDAAREALSPRLDGLDSLDQDGVRGTLSAYVTLKELAAEQKLGGLAVRCWPEFFTELGCAACGAMSMLSDELTPCSCEADVNGTITQLILQWLSGGPAFGTDVVSFDVEENSAVLWHCGLAPLSMADPDAAHPRATIHSNRQLPLLMEFPLKPGRVTVARLSEASGSYRLVVAGAEVLAAPPSFTGTSGVLRFDRPAADVLDTIMQEGLEHHVSLTYGDYVPALLALADLLGLPVLRLA